MREFASGQCRYGVLLVAISERGITDAAFGDSEEELISELCANGDVPRSSTAALQAWQNFFDFLEGPHSRFEHPLDVQGTEFLKRVWTALSEIPAGKTLTYKELADSLGAPGSVRAVAGACAANRIAVAIPCHRVIRTSGELAGYRWGLGRKRQLLDYENALESSSQLSLIP